MAKKQPNSIVAAERIEQAILLVRGHKVLLDSELARLYGVETKALVRATKRNRERFPADFMFQLTREEWAALKCRIGALDLRCQIGTSSQERGTRATNHSRAVVTPESASHGGRRHAPYAFTEQGVAMLSSVLRSPRAVQVNIEIMRAFVRLRHVLAVNADLARRLDEVEQRLGEHDEQFVQVIRAIRELMQPPPGPPRRRIGFHAAEEPPDAKPSGRAGHARRGGHPRATPPRSRP
jgi:GAF domain-containing protein